MSVNDNIYVRKIHDRRVIIVYSVFQMVNVCAKKIILAMSAESLKRITFEEPDVDKKMAELLPSVNQVHLVLSTGLKLNLLQCQ